MRKSCNDCECKLQNSKTVLKYYYKNWKIDVLALIVYPKFPAALYVPCVLSYICVGRGSHIFIIFFSSCRVCRYTVVYNWSAKSAQSCPWNLLESLWNHSEALFKTPDILCNPMTHGVTITPRSTPESSWILLKMAWIPLAVGMLWTSLQPQEIPSKLHESPINGQWNPMKRVEISLNLLKGPMESQEIH